MRRVTLGIWLLWPLCLVAAGDQATTVPKLPIKSGIITYKMTVTRLWDNATQSEDVVNPFGTLYFDDYGAILAEKAENESDRLGGNFETVLYRDGYAYQLDSSAKVATRRALENSGQEVRNLIGPFRGIQALMGGARAALGRRASDFISFKKTGTMTIANRVVDIYEYQYGDGAWGCNEKQIFGVQKGMLLFSKSYWCDKPMAVLEAVDVKENASIDAERLAVPEGYRIVDADKLDRASGSSIADLETARVVYTSTIAAGLGKKTGTKTLYVGQHGRLSAEEWEGTITYPPAIGLPAKREHQKIIRDAEVKRIVDYEEKTMTRLVLEGIADESIARRQYVFSNRLYGNNVRATGTATLLGKSCEQFEFTSVNVVSQACVWNGIFLTLRESLCLDAPACDERRLLREETATEIEENPKLGEASFGYPIDFEAKQ